MKISVWTSFLLILMACNTDCPETGNLVNHNLDVILVIGQSNTHYGLGLDSELDASDDRIFQLGRCGGADRKIIEAKEPLQHHTWQSGRIGFALTFAKAYLNTFLTADLERNVAIIPGGSGGTSFTDNHWNKGDYLYEDAVERSTYILQNFPNSKIVGILWHQGESDVGNPNYQTDLDQFILDIRQDLGNDSLPFILGGMVPFWVDQAGDRMTHQAIINQTVERIDFTGYADPSLPFVIAKSNDEADEIHYDASGQRELGRRYFEEFLEIVE